MLRRLALLASFLSLPLGASADLAPWETPAPASAPAGSSAPAAPGAPAAAAGGADLAAFTELLDLVADPELVKKLRAAPEEKRAAAMSGIWSQDLREHERARFTWIASNLRENGQVATARATTLLVLGPPQTMHSEASRAWTGEIERIDDLQALRARLNAGSAAATATKTPVQGSFPTEVWVYPGASVNELRVVTFVDEDGDGTFRFAGDERRPAGSPPSSAPGVEPPSSLFPPLSAAGDVEALPALTKEGLPVGLMPLFFKASAGRTFTRFVVTVDPADVEMELEGDPAAYAAGGRAVVRVEQGGVAAWQGSVPLAQGGGTDTSPWMTELSVPLAPGKYDVTALVADGAGAGGRKTMAVEVPAFGGKLAVSTPVVAKVVGTDLPKAPAAAGEAMAPFQVGNYVVRPQPGATFQRGDQAAFVLQVYDAPSATIEYDLYADGSFQSGLEPEQIKSLPSTQINIIEIAPQYRDGSYSFKVTVKDPAAPAGAVVVQIPFRVKGGPLAP